MTYPQTICILRLSAIGDVCHAVAVVQAIQAHLPFAKLTWVIGRTEFNLVKNLPGIDFVVFDKQQGINAYRKLRADLPQTFDVLLHMQVALRANLAAACIRAKRKIGFPRQLSKEFHSIVVTERVAMPESPHVLDGFVAFARAIGVPPFEPSWNIPLDDSDRRWLENTLARLPPVAQQFVVISPSASKAERNWLPDRYAHLIDHAFNRGFSVILCGGQSAAERDLGAAIESFCHQPPLNLIGQSSLTQLLALLGKAAVVISPDSGPAHMATTQGTPVVGLYAHSNPARTGPYYSLPWVAEVYHKHLTLQTGNDDPNILDKQRLWGFRLKGKALMADISVTQVKALFDQLCRAKGLTNGQ